MTTLSEIARRTARFAVNKSPTILTAVGVVGAITTAYLAGKASFEAADIIRLKEGDDEARGVLITDRNELMKQRIELVWKLYIPATAMGAATVACIIGSNHIHGKRAAGLAAAYVINNRILDQYKDKVVETIGARKAEQIQDAIAQDNVTAAANNMALDVFEAKDGYLCQDMFSLQFFRSTAERIEGAVNEFNALLIDQGGQASLADLYELMGLECPSYSEQIGWDINRGGLLKVKIGGATAHDRIPILTVEFKTEPTPDFHRFR